MTNPSEESYPIVIPRLGLTMVEASVVEWYFKEGDWVNKGEPLFALENEKSVVDIEAPTSGYLRILAPTGVTFPVLTVIGELSPTPIASQPSPAAAALRMSVPADGGDGKRSEVRPSETKPAVEPRRVTATPKARRLARELGVELSTLEGSGLRGMVIAADVRREAAALKRRATPVAERMAAEAGIDLASVKGSGLQGRVTRQDIERALAERQAAAVERKPLKQQPLSGFRAVIAERLAQSWRERPQVTLFTEADAVNLVQARQQLNQALPSEEQKVSYNALLIKLCALALAEHPLLNAYLEGNQIVYPEDINIALAVDTERGLTVPVIHQVQQKTLRQIHHELLEKVERALNNRCTPEDLDGGTFTITNLGAYDIDGFTPILNPPQTAILGVGKIRSKPVGYQGQLVLREQVTLSLSFDHRLVDGAPAARFLQRIKHLIENPFMLAW